MTIANVYLIGLTVMSCVAMYALYMIIKLSKKIEFEEAHLEWASRDIGFYENAMPIPDKTDFKKNIIYGVSLNCIEMQETYSTKPPFGNGCFRLYEDGTVEVFVNANTNFVYRMPSYAAGEVYDHMKKVFEEVEEKVK